MDRRTVLVAGGAVAAGGLLAACGSSDSASPASDTGAAGGSSAAAPPADGALATVSEVPVEGGYVNQDSAVVVTQPQAGTYKAFTAVCPHQGCLVSQVVANEIICPCHMSKFSAADGSVISGPATQGLAAADVMVKGDSIVLA